MAQETQTNTPQYANFRISSKFVGEPYPLMNKKEGTPITTAAGKQMMGARVTFPPDTKINGVDVSGYRFEVAFPEGKYDIEQSQMNKEQLTFGLSTSRPVRIYQKQEDGSIKDYEINNAFDVAKAIKDSREAYKAKMQAQQKDSPARDDVKKTLEETTAKANRAQTTKSEPSYTRDAM